MHQIERISIAIAYPMSQHANRTLLVATIHFSKVVYCMRFDAIVGIHGPYDKFHDAINMRKYSAKFYRVVCQLSMKTQEENRIKEGKNQIKTKQDVE